MTISKIIIPLFNYTLKRLNEEKKELNYILNLLSDNSKNEKIIQINDTKNCDTIIDKNEKIIKNDIIKSIYKKLANKTHPDKINNKDLNELFVVAKNAYELNDENLLKDITKLLNRDINPLININNEYKQFRQTIGYKILTLYKSNNINEAKKLFNEIL